MDALLRSTFQILTHGQKTNSYKFALLRALADLVPSKELQPQHLTRTVLANRFIEYYWPLTTKYRVRQGTDPAKDPVVMRHLRSLMARGSIGSRDSVKDLVRRHRAEYDTLVRTVANQAFGDVIPRFHTVRRAPIKPPLYWESDDGVLIPPESVRFLRTHRDLVRFLAIAGWVKFTQAFSSAPRLFEKISDEPPRRRTGAYRRPLLEISHSSCFYCGSFESSPVIDHVIPWAYVLEDRAWNLVLACRACNGRKSDGLPMDETLERLVSRNNQLTGGTRSLPRKIASDLAEWPTSQACSDHIRALYEHARQDGFLVWAGPPSRRPNL